MNNLVLKANFVRFIIKCQREDYAFGYGRDDYAFDFGVSKSDLGSS